MIKLKQYLFFTQGGDVELGPVYLSSGRDPLYPGLVGGSPDHDRSPHPTPAATVPSPPLTSQAIVKILAGTEHLTPVLRVILRTTPLNVDGYVGRGYGRFLVVQVEVCVDLPLDMLLNGSIPDISSA